MTNFSPQAHSAHGGSQELPQDPKLRRAYEELSKASPAPAPAVHLAIRERAQVARGGGRWIWPASIAASLVLCTTLVLQFAKVLQPRLPPPVAGADGPIPVPATFPPAGQPAPPVGAAPVTGVSRYSAVPQSLAPGPDSPEFWWEQLRMHANNADRAGFLATWEIYQQRRDNPPLPADLRRWMADNQVPLTDQNDG